MPGNLDPAAGLALQTADQHHHGCFAGTRRSDHADGLAGGYFEINPFKDVDGTGFTVQLKFNTVQENHGFPYAIIDFHDAPQGLL